MSGVPQLKSDEFAARYNRIEQDHYGEFQLRALARDAWLDFEQSGNLLSGFIAASCWFDLGKTEKGFAFFKRELSGLPFNNQTPWLMSVYLQYARMLVHLKKNAEATMNLDKISEGILSLNDYMSTLVAVSLYSKTGNDDKAFSLVEQAIQRHPDWQDRLVHPALLRFFVRENDQEGAISYFFDLAYAIDLELEAENIDYFLDILRQALTHPKLHPELSETEITYLQTTRKWVLDYLAGETERDTQAATEALRRLNDPEDEVIPLEQVVKALGLENAI